MALTPAQQQTLKAYIEADATLNAFPLNSDGAFAIAQLLNLQASPDFFVYRKAVETMEIGKVVVYTAIGALTSNNQGRLTAFLDLNPVDFEPTVDIRAMFDDIFSGALGGGGEPTRDALTALWKRLATRFEEIFATGTGSDASPATMAAVGPVAYTEVEAARNLP